MDWLKIDSECVKNKEIPLSILQKHIGYIDPRVDSVYLYACINSQTFPINCVLQNDSYYNELFIYHIDLKDYMDVDRFCKQMLKVILYQSIFIFHFANQYCISTGFTRNAKKRYGDRIVEQYHTTKWLTAEKILEYGLFSAIKTKAESYQSIFYEINDAIKEISHERYIPLSFVAELYAYFYGLGELNLEGKIRLQNSLKELYPEICIKSKLGKDVFRFNENEVLELINKSIVSEDHYYDDLTHVLFELVEYDNFFNIELPKQLREKVSEYSETYYKSMLNQDDNIDVNPIDPHDWL